MGHSVCIACLLQRLRPGLPPSTLPRPPPTLLPMQRLRPGLPPSPPPCPPLPPHTHTPDHEAAPAWAPAFWSTSETSTRCTTWPQSRWLQGLQVCGGGAWVWGGGEGGEYPLHNVVAVSVAPRAIDR